MTGAKPLACLAALVIALQPITTTPSTRNRENEGLKLHTIFLRPGTSYSFVLCSRQVESSAGFGTQQVWRESRRYLRVVCSKRGLSVHFGIMSKLSTLSPTENGSFWFVFVYCVAAIITENGRNFRTIRAIISQENKQGEKNPRLLCEVCMRAAESSYCFLKHRDRR